MENKFLVYKSSAGSGKTTTLVKEYLKICLKNPGDFRHVLAITFTNKAANEMKSKIISSLEDFSKGRLNHPLSMEISREIGLTPSQIIFRAENLLSLIIHHYDEFSVSTIDSFVHQIVRTFAADLHLPQSFEVVIDNDDLVPFIREDIYGKLGKDAAFTNILSQFVLSKVEDEQTYNLDAVLTDFIKKQLGEEGFTEANELSAWQAKDFLVLIKKLKDNIGSIKAQIRDFAKASIDLIESQELRVDDFYRKKSGVMAYLERLLEWPAELAKLYPNSYVQKARDENLWYTNITDSSIKTRIDSISASLRDNLLEIDKQLELYAIRVLVYRNIYQVALIREIRALFRAFTEKTGAVHISEFNKRIHEEIAAQPVPFIYERIGRRYKHFLIDEFQDTSVLQWNNLLPLIEESLANGHFNMLVGDAKQAIYRFRNGEVELFTHLPKLFNQEDTIENRVREQALVRNYQEKKLAVNYRSREEIIAFNNAFFDEAAQTLPALFKDIYAGHVQLVPENKKEGGNVTIDWVEAENAAEYGEVRQEKVLEWVKELAARQYPLQDICVLTRTNRSAADLAAFLLNHGYPVVSPESLKLTVSVEVNMVVAFLKCLLEPDNKLYLLELITHFHKLYGVEEDLHALYSRMLGEPEPLAWFLHHFDISFSSLQVLRTRTPIEIAIEAISRLVRSKEPNIFLQYFLDFVFEKQAVYKGSLSEFLKLWEEKKEGLNIKMSEGLNAIQVMTAHKAKGLKFGVVIAELSNISKKLTRKYFWSEVSMDEMKGLPKALFTMGKELEYIGMESEYDYESAKTDLDFVNLVYVAFTRAVDALFVVGGLIKGKPDIFSKLLMNFFGSKGLWKEEERHYTFGGFPAMVDASTSEGVEAVDLNEQDTAPWYEHLLVSPVDEVYWEAMNSKASRTFGKIIHAILAQVKWPEEMEQRVDAFFYAGVLDDTEAQKLKDLLHKTLSHPEIAPYFEKGLVIKSETELFDKEQGSYLRPDRVVIDGNKLTIIDYKTGESKPSHKKQLYTYAAVYARMGYQHIEKKLIYLYPDIKVVNVS